MSSRKIRLTITKTSLKIPLILLSLKNLILLLNSPPGLRKFLSLSQFYHQPWDPILFFPLQDQGVMKAINSASFQMYPKYPSNMSSPILMAGPLKRAILCAHCEEVLSHACNTSEPCFRPSLSLICTIAITSSLVSRTRTFSSPTHPSHYYHGTFQNSNRDYITFYGIQCLL